MADNTSEKFPLWTLLALLVSAVGVMGSIWLSVGMELLACPFCYYQRTFMMAAMGILAVGLLSGIRPFGRVSLLALPAAIGGLGVAGFHVSRIMAGAMECPEGMLGIGTAPHQSLAAFVVLTLLLGVDVCCSCCCGASDGSGGKGMIGSLFAILLGVAFAFGCIKSTAMVPLPPELKTGDLKICRPPPK